jgi:hypothetical protein
MSGPGPSDDPLEPPAPTDDARSPAPSAAPRNSASPSAAYRARRARQKAPWTATVAGVLTLLVAVLVLYIATSGILTPAASSGGPGPGIGVVFANPVLGNTSCGGSATFPTEQLRIAGLSRPFTTAQASVEVIELGDGDILPTVTARPETSMTALCTGAPPPPGISWYAVLVSPYGQNLATYTYSQSWSPVEGASFPASFVNDSSLTFVMSENLANQGYGAVLSGSTAATPITGEAFL